MCRAYRRTGAVLQGGGKVTPGTVLICGEVTMTGDGSHEKLPGDGHLAARWRS
jgi:hypothetical protein